MREILQWILIGVHEIFEIHDFDLFQYIDSNLFKIFISPYQLKLGMILLSSN